MDSVPVRKPPCIFDKRLSEQVDIRLAQVEHVFLTLMWFLAAHMDRRSRRWRCIVRKFVDLPSLSDHAIRVFSNLFLDWVAQISMVYAVFVVVSSKQ